MKLRILMLTILIICCFSSTLYASRSLPLISSMSYVNLVSRLNDDFRRNNFNIRLTTPKPDKTLSTSQLTAYTSYTSNFVPINFYTNGNNIYRISAVFEKENNLMRDEAIKVLFVSCIEAGMSTEEAKALFHLKPIGNDTAENSIFSRKLRKKIDSTVIVNDDLACLSVMAFDY